jgi:hypothetical protein
MFPFQKAVHCVSLETLTDPFPDSRVNAGPKVTVISAPASIATDAVRLITIMVVARGSLGKYEIAECEKTRGMIAGDFLTGSGAKYCDPDTETVSDGSFSALDEGRTNWFETLIVRIAEF